VNNPTSDFSSQTDALLESWIKPDYPGFAVTIVQNGCVVYQQGYGWANLEWKTPITPHTVFDTGSSAKQFTAFAIAMLADRGEISLDEDIRAYIHKLPAFKQIVTLRNLIHHTSGLWNWSAFTPWLGEFTSLEQVIRLVAKQNELNFEPGTRFEYCNTGYNLLAEIIQRISGVPFSQWMSDNVFAPLGMRHTCFLDQPGQLIPFRADGYVEMAAGILQRASAHHPVGSSALFTTVEDLARWLFNFRNGELGGQNLQQMIRQPGTLANDVKLRYALGLFLGKYKETNVIEHGGECPGFRSLISYFPDLDFGVALLANHKGMDVHRCSRQIVDLFYPPRETSKPSPVVKPIKPENSPSLTSIARYTGQYLIEAGHILTIFGKQNQLYWQITGQPPFELHAISASEFLDKDGDPVTFHIDPHGHVNQVTLIWAEGKPLTAQRIIFPEPEELQQYQGTYINRELEIRLHLNTYGDHLIAQNLRLGNIRLSYCDIDQFCAEPWWFRQVDYKRTPDGKIKGFSVCVREGFKELFFSKQSERK